MKNYCSNCSKGNSTLNIQYEVSPDSGNFIYTINIDNGGNSSFGFENYAKPKELKHNTEESAFQNYTMMNSEKNDDSNFYMTFNQKTDEKKKDNPFETENLARKMTETSKKDNKSEKKSTKQGPSIAEIENSDYNPLEDILGRY